MLLTKDNILSLVKSIPGIYYIQNTLNNKCYIGLSINLRLRLLFHVNNAKFSQLHIHRAINKYGLKNFKFKILLILDIESCNIKNSLDYWEKFYIRKYNSYLNGYNSTIGGDKGVLGLLQSNKTKLHLRNIRKLQLHKKYDIECWCYNLNSKLKYHLNHIYEIVKLTNKYSMNTIIRIMDKDKFNNSNGFIYAYTENELLMKIDHILKLNKKFTFKLNNLQLFNLKLSHSKYQYLKYDLNYNLLSCNYLYELKQLYNEKTINKLRNMKCNEEFKFIDCYYWKKQKRCELVVKKQ